MSIATSAAGRTFKFDSDGFLTKRRDELEVGVRANYSDLFDGALQINRDCHDLLFSANVRNRDGEALIVATLFMRMLDHYQATLILLGRGVIAPARVTLRALIETTFKMRAIEIDPNALKTFVLEDLVHRKNLVNKTRNSPDFADESHIQFPDQLLEELKERIKTTGAEALRTEQWSTLAGMHDWYVTNYALLSKAVHTQSRELEDYLQIESDEVRQIRYGPSLEDIPLLILTAAQGLLIGASAFDKKFDLEFGPKGDQHTKFVEEGFQALDPPS